MTLQTVRPLLISLPLLPDELLSSWLIRTALAHGCDPLVLTGELWPGWRVWTVDPDRDPPTPRLDVLAGASGWPVAAFQAAALRSTLQAVTAAELHERAAWPWLLALGSRGRTRKGGLQCCPPCLAADPQPYHRRAWRLAWHTACPHHHVRLLDRCPQCQAPLEPHRVSVIEEGQITHCPHCRADHSAAAVGEASEAALAFQQAADDVVARGQGLFGDVVLSSQEWFELARYSLFFLRRATLYPGSALAATLSAVGVPVSDLRPTATGLALELLPTHEREGLLAALWPLMCAGPGAFVAAAQDAGLDGAALYQMRDTPPAVIAGLAAQLPERRRTRSKSEDQDTKPRSRASVMRMYARLERKL